MHPKANWRINLPIDLDFAELPIFFTPLVIRQVFYFFPLCGIFSNYNMQLIFLQIFFNYQKIVMLTYKEN